VLTKVTKTLERYAFYAAFGGLGLGLIVGYGWGRRRRAA
jgi:hypothetical protein